MMNGRDVNFIYNEKTYVWAGDGKVRHLEMKPEFGKPIEDVELSEEEF